MGHLHTASDLQHFNLENTHLLTQLPATFMILFGSMHDIYVKYVILPFFPYKDCPFSDYGLHDTF